MPRFGELRLPTHVQLWQHLSTIAPSGTFTWGTSASQIFQNYVSDESGVNGESFSQTFLLAAGSYTLSVLGATLNTSPKIDWYLDGVLVVSGQDWYSSSLTYSVIKTASVTVCGNGFHTLKAVVNGRNAGNTTGYRFICTCVWLK